MYGVSVWKPFGIGVTRLLRFAALRFGAGRFAFAFAFLRAMGTSLLSGREAYSARCTAANDIVVKESVIVVKERVIVVKGGVSRR
jgi:hypothetical protein